MLQPSKLLPSTSSVANKFLNFPSNDQSQLKEFLVPPKSIKAEIKPGGCLSMFLSTREQQTNILGVDLDLDKSHIFSWTFPLTRLGGMGRNILFRGVDVGLAARL